MRKGPECNRGLCFRHMIRTWKSFLRHKLSLYIWCLYKSISFCYLFIKLFIFHSHYCLLLNWTVLWVLWHRNVSFSGTNKGIQMLILIISTILKVISRFWLIKHVFTDSLCCQSFLLAMQKLSCGFRGRVAAFWLNPSCHLLDNWRYCRWLNETGYLMNTPA